MRKAGTQTARVHINIKFLNVSAATKAIDYDKTVYDVTIEVRLDEGSERYKAEISFFVNGQEYADTIRFLNKTRPVTHEKSEKPEKPGRGPKTGDSGGLMLWTVLMTLSAGGMTTVFYIKKTKARAADKPKGICQ